MIQAKNTLKGKLNVSVVKEYPELEEITVTPTLDGQELKPNKYGYSKITVEGIPATDVTIEPTIKEQTKTGIFKNVTVNAIEGETLNLNPSEEQQNYEGVFLGVNIKPIQVEEIETNLDFSSGNAIELTAQEGAYIKKATINKDANLSPENIKSGVTIAGVSGDVADTSDADATSDDIIAGKTAYVANEKIAGTYIPLDTSDATATAEDIAKDKTAYVNGEKVVGTALPSFDSSQILYAKEMFLNNTVVEDLRGLDTSGVLQATGMCSGCTNLKYLDTLDFRNTTYVNLVFSNCTSLVTLPFLVLSTSKNNVNIAMICNTCTNLVNVPELDTSNVTNMINAFQNCPKLSPESLNNIMAMCIKATGVSSANKNLYYVGLTSDQREICKNQSNYQAFLSAGWKLA